MNLNKLKISAEQAVRAKLIEIAKIVAKDNNWRWQEPSEITSTVINDDPVWIIHSNIMKRGQNIRIVVRKSDFTVLESGYLPR